MTLPATDSKATFISVVALINASTPTNPNTDLAAAALMTLIVNSAMSTRTQPRAWVSFTWNATVVARTDHDAVWGGSSLVAPTVVRDSAGVVTLTWPTTITNEAGELHTINFRRAKRPNVESSSANIWVAEAKKMTANTVRVRFLDAGFAVGDPPEEVEIMVEVL